MPAGGRGAAAAVAACLLAACAGAPPARAVSVTDLGARVAVAVDGEAFAEYRRDNLHRPVVWPLYAPGGIAVTRAFPFAEVAGEPRDHPLQESVWFGHGDVNGYDFWEGHCRVVEVESSCDPASGEVRGVSSWQLPDGREVCRDFHRYAFSATADVRAVDVDLTLVASDGELVLGDTRDGTFGVRLRPEFSLRGDAAGGAILDSEGRTGRDVWGKRARWVAYAAEVRGEFLVVAVFDHPKNHGHPTHWHARDYGLLAANPFGLEGFTGSPAGTGALRLPAGGQLRCRYRVHIARGRPQLAAIETAWQAWSARP